MILLHLLVLPLLQEPAQLGVGRYTVDPERSEVGFHGTSTLHDFTARTDAVRGELRGDLAHPAALCAGRLSVEAVGLDTQNEERDEKMREHLEVAEFPTLDFVVDRVEGELTDGAGELQVVGSFHIHGVEKRRRVPVTIAPAAGGGVRVTGSCTFPMSEHGIEPPQVLVITVGDPVEVFFDLVLVPVPAAAVDAVHRALAVTEDVAPAGGAAERRSSGEHLWIAEDRALWARDAAHLWLLAADGACARVDVEQGAVRPAAVACDVLFSEARAQAVRLREKLATLPAGPAGRVREAVERIERGLAHAPAPGPLRVERTGGALVWSLGDTEWLRAEELFGDERVLGTLLAGLDGLPAVVRDELPELRGIPRRLVVRTATPAAVQSLEILIGEDAPGQLPDWALAASTWAPPGDGGEGVSR